MSKDYEQTLAMAEKALGPDHPNTTKVMINLADVYKNIGKKDKATELETRAQEISAKHKQSR